MDTLEFKKILEITDKELEEAKREWEAKARREQLEQRKRILLHWKERLEARKAEFAKYGATPSVDLDAKISEIKRELEALEKEPSGNGEAPEETPSVDPAAKAAVQNVQKLLEEINHGPSIADMPFVERVLKLHEWALRWKIETFKAGESAGEDRTFKAGYAAILTLRDQVAKGNTLPGLSRQPGVLEEWKAALEEVRYRQAELLREREVQEPQARASEDAYMELYSYMGGTQFDQDTLRHLVRKAASFVHLRPEIARLLDGHRALIGPEFAFLWAEEGEEEPEEPESKKLSNREIAARILRRLKAKGMIGASHAPAEKVSRGFAGHDYGRAEEALETLVKAGIVRQRKTGIGFRVSIEPAMVPAADLAIEERPTGIALFDDWVRKEE